MDRRGFLGSLIGGVATSAAVRTWPFRVFSFPTEIIKPEIIAVNWWEREFIVVNEALTIEEFERRYIQTTWKREPENIFNVGDTFMLET